MGLRRTAVILQRTEKWIRQKYVSRHGRNIALPRWRYSDQVISFRCEGPGTVVDVVGISSELIVGQDRVLKVKRGAPPIIHAAAYRVQTGPVVRNRATKYICRTDVANAAA